MSIIVHIDKDFEIHCVALNAANVFRRTFSFAFNTNQVVDLLPTL